MNELSFTDPRAWAGVGALVFLVLVLVYVYHHAVYLMTTPKA